MVASAGNTARAFAQVCSDNNIPIVIAIFLKLRAFAYFSVGFYKVFREDLTPNEKKDKTVIKDVRPATAIKHRKKNPMDFEPLYMPELEDVWFYKPATIAWFADGTKTIAIAGHGDKYDKETGLAICMLKRVLGNKEYRKIMDTWCYKKGSAN